MSAAMHAIERLLASDFGPLQEAQVSILRTILDCHEVMHHLLESLVDVYRCKSGDQPPRIKAHDLVGVAQGVVDLLKPIARRKRLTVTCAFCDEHAVVLCDVDQIRRVMHVLIANALTVTPVGGSVNVDILRSSRSTTLVIRDTRKSISDQDKASLFKGVSPLVTGRADTNIGLGLHTCRKIVELHAGHIRCDSADRGGNTFYVQLPNAGPSRSDSGLRQSHPRRPMTRSYSVHKTIRVLVVEDDPLIRRCIKKTLAGDGIIVVGEAETAQMAVTLFTNLNPDVVLMDIGLPDGNGIDVAAKINSDQEAALILMYTSFDDEDHVKQSLAAGASGYCIKSHPQLLNLAIRSVYAGAIWLDPALAEGLLGNFSCAVRA
jgi:CheY-like chemotaxis protein